MTNKELKAASERYNDYQYWMAHSEKQDNEQDRIVWLNKAGAIHSFMADCGYYFDENKKEFVRHGD